MPVSQGPSTGLVLFAPLSGPLVPIEQVPDPVFAQKLVGDGVSIDPVTSCLLAPCDGTVIQAHGAGHAVTLRALGGVEIVIHIGLDTVALKGEGFLPRVKAGDAVTTGQPLIEFAADYVASQARSLLTQVVVATPERIASLRARTGYVEAGRDPILELTLAGQAEAVAADASPARVSEPIVVPNPSGLHARPAAVLAAAARRFRADVRVRRGDEEANAKSVTSLMGLEILQGHRVAIVAAGPDAEEAVTVLRGLLESGLGEEATASAAPAPSAPPRPVSVPAGEPNLLIGVSASPGLAMGSVFQLRHQDIVVAETGASPAEERRRLERALEQARLQLEALRGKLQGQAEADKAAIFAAHEELLEDPDLLQIAWDLIDGGKSAGFAWRQAFESHADRLSHLVNELLKARAADLRDVGRRVLSLVEGATPQEPVRFPERCILVAEDLTPSDTAGLDRTRVVGFCTVGGGATSHVAILARSLDIPAIAGIEGRALEVPSGTPAILDGHAGTLRLQPSTEEVARVRALQEQHGAKRKAAAAAAQQEARTRDGRRIEVAANIGSLAEAEQAVALGGEGVGLLRSEFLFLERSTPPSEDEQYDTYAAIARCLGKERPLVIRTLDVGGDKPLPYLPIPHEENPFLGIRGLRILLDHADVFRTQLRAILRASSDGRVCVMLPMVATISELRAARGIFEEERARLGVAPLPLGIMVEVPSAALMAGVFAREADFFSVGTNDLTQYTLAMDRGHPKLAPQVDGLSPAVLRLIAESVKAAHAHGRWVGVCGGIAGDPQAVPILVGLGVDELSVSVPAIPTVKAQVRDLSEAACRGLAEQALLAESAAAVRALVPRA
jgi:phosphocarrier protein FPr